LWGFETLSGKTNPAFLKKQDLAANNLLSCLQRSPCFAPGFCIRADFGLPASGLLLVVIVSFKSIPPVRCPESSMQFKVLLLATEDLESRSFFKRMGNV
jgi:hypothetical protein